MNKPFDMKIFLAGMLTGAHATRERHIRQAEAIQATISERWRRENPWTWQRKHLAWFLDHHVSQRSVPTRYYYLLTIRLIVIRLKSLGCSVRLRRISIPVAHRTRLISRDKRSNKIQASIRRDD